MSKISKSRKSGPFSECGQLIFEPFVESQEELHLLLNPIDPDEQTAFELIEESIDARFDETNDDQIDAVFYRTDQLLYHKFRNTVIFLSGNLHSLCSPGNQDYQKMTLFLFFIKKARNRPSKLIITTFLLSISAFFDEKIKNE